MGLQILPADIPPPALIRGDSAPRPPERDRASRFDGYLKDARSSVETEPSTQNREAQRPDAGPSTDVDEKDAGAAPPAGPGEETTVHEPIVATSPPVATGPNAANQTPDVVEPSAASSLLPKQQPAGIPPNPSAETTEQGSSQPAPAPRQVETLGQEAKLPGQNVQQRVSQDTSAAQTTENVERGGRTASRTLPDELTPVKELPDGPWRQTPKATDQSRAGEGAADIKQPGSVKLPQELGPNHGLATDPGRDRQETVGARPASSPERPSRLAQDQSRARAGVVSTKSPVPRPVTLKAGKGDGAAASFAKFLITAANQNGSGSLSNAAAPVSGDGIGQAAGNVASTAGPIQAPVANLVADLLAARVDDGDAIKGAARVLNASGRSGKFEVTMQLDPPELGQLKLQIQMRQQGLILRVEAQTQVVAKMIESRLVELSEALGVHGIRVDRAEVTVRSGGSTQADAQSPEDNGPSKHGEFDQASTRDQDGGNQGEAASYQAADRHLSDPKHPVEDLDAGPYQDDHTAIAGIGADANDPIMPTMELSVNLVA